MKTQNKVFRINGREIPEVSLDKRYPEQMPLVLAFNILLEALDEKKEVSSVTFQIPPGDKTMLTKDGGKTWEEYKPERAETERYTLSIKDAWEYPKQKEPKPECKHEDGYTCGSCNSCGKNNPMIGGKGQPKSILKEEINDIIFRSDVYSTSRDTDKIISLFKDTLLKEIDTKAEYFKTETGREIMDYKDIINIIKNL